MICFCFELLVYCRFHPVRTGDILPSLMVGEFYKPPWTLHPRHILAQLGDPNQNFFYKGDIVIIKNVVNVYIFGLAIDIKMLFGVGKL